MVSDGGLALANTVATSLEMVGLLVIMRRRLDGLQLRSVVNGLLQAAAAAVVMSLGLSLWLAWSAARPVWLVALGGILIGGLLYGAVLLALRVPEVQYAAELLRQRLTYRVSPGDSQ